MSVSDLHSTAIGLKVVDLTTSLHEGVSIIRLPEHLGQPWPFRREVISEYDDRGPAFWHNLCLSEHTGTHFDAPIHWPSGRHLHDVSAVPVGDLIGPAAVVDCRAAVAADPGFLLQRDHLEQWQDEHGALPAGWLLYQTGWSDRSADGEAFHNGGITPGISPECARWLAEETPIVGIGVETVGTDAGQAETFDPPFPCHFYMHGAGKYGVTQLRNLDRVPAKGALLVVAPLPIVGGSGSPARIFALIMDGGQQR